MYDFRSLVYTRERRVDNVDSWVWPITDTGAWDGPVNDWETSHREKYLKHTPGRSTVIQAGGNCGLYPRLLADIFQCVYTFEPDPLNFYCLTRNCEQVNIVKFQAALGSSHKMIDLYRLTDQNVGMHQVRESPTGFIPQLCIDDLDLVSCDLICLDIEGYEINALKGAAHTIAKFRPTIVCENGNKEIADFLLMYDYQMVDTSKMDTIYVARNRTTS